MSRCEYCGSHSIQEFEDHFDVGHCFECGIGVPLVWDSRDNWMFKLKWKAVEKERREQLKLRREEEKLLRKKTKSHKVR